MGGLGGLWLELWEGRRGHGVILWDFDLRWGRGVARVICLQIERSEGEFVNDLLEFRFYELMVTI